MSFLIQATVGFSPTLVWQHWLLPQCVLDVPKNKHILGRTATTLTPINYIRPYFFHSELYKAVGSIQ